MSPPCDKHLDLQNRPFSWLASRITGRGLRGGMEIPVAQGYVADAVIACDFQYRHEIRYYGNPTYYDWHKNAGVKTSSILIFEAKATLADFQSTFGGRDNEHANRLIPVGTLHWVIIPKGCYSSWSSSIKKLPAWWGILEESGKGLRELKQPEPCAITADAYNAICMRILWYQS